MSPKRNRKGDLGTVKKKINEKQRERDRERDREREIEIERGREI